MLQRIHQDHHTDGNGNPTGGTTTGTGITIQWQDGPLGRGLDRKEPNGAFVEGVIVAAGKRRWPGLQITTLFPGQPEGSGTAVPPAAISPLTCQPTGTPEPSSRSKSPFSTGVVVSVTGTILFS